MLSTYSKRSIANRSIGKSALVLGGSSTPSVPVDPYWYNVVALMHMDGIVSASPLVDQRRHVVTTYGDTKLSAAQSIFGGTSAYFDGTGDYLTFDGSNDYSFGTGDFTVELWVRRTVTGVQQCLFRLAGSSQGASVQYPGILINTSDKLTWYAGGFVITGTTSMAINTWYHVAISRVSGVTRAFLNGTQEGSNYTDANNYLVGTARPVIGCDETLASSMLTGYIDELRITKGVGRYSANFTVPAMNFYDDSPVFTAGSDPYWNNVVALLHGEGTNGSSTFIDQKGRPVTTTGNPLISTSNKKFGSSSIYLDGVGSKLAYPASSDWNLGSNYTIEFWLYTLALPLSGNACRVVVIGTNGSTSCNVVEIAPNGSLRVGVPGQTNAVSNAGAVVVGGWHHYAVSVNAGAASIYCDGVSVVTPVAIYTQTASSADTLIIGFDTVATVNTNYQGYIDDLRITKGVGRYLTAFVPPQQAFYNDTVTPSIDPYWANTVLLMHMDGLNGSTALIEQRSHTFTGYGDAKLSTAKSRFGPTSLALDGTGDYIALDGSSDFVFGTGDFTIECWVYANAIGSQMTLYDGRPGANGVHPYLYITSTGTVALLVSSANRLGSSGTVPVGVWTHIALVRINSVTNLYIGGISTTGGPYADTNSYATISAGYPHVGADMSASTGFNGYIDDLRITKGAGRYTQNFIPPQLAHYDGYTSASSDPYWNNVAALLHMDGASAGTVFTDQRGHVVTPAGNTNTSTAQVKYGTTSAYFDGVGDYLTFDGSADFAFGLGDFTLEFWFYTTVIGGVYAVYDSRPSATTGVYPQINLTSTAHFTIDTNGASNITGTLTVAVNTWYHLALCRANGVTRLFVNGVQDGNSYTDSNNYINGAARPALGSQGWSLGSNAITGYIDDLRVTKGVARYTTTFTPPASPFPNY